MSSSQSLRKSSQFTARTPCESICMTCYATVRASTSEILPSEQQRHLAECSGEIGGFYPSRYMAKRAAAHSA